MYRYTVTRTQMFIDDEMLGVLRSVAQQRKTTVSHLVREAVARFLATESRSGPQMLDATAGLWAGRTDLPPTEDYVRALRGGGRRRKRLGLD